MFYKLTSKKSLSGELDLHSFSYESYFSEKTHEFEYWINVQMNQNMGNDVSIIERLYDKVHPGVILEKVNIK